MSRWRSWAYTCASSFVCTSPLAVITFVGFLDFRRVSSSPKLSMSVRWLSSFCLPSLYLSLLPFLFHCLPVLCPGHHTPFGRNCQVQKPLRTRRMRSIAPRRTTILSQVMSPTSSTTSTTQRLLQWSSRMDPATSIRSLRTRVTRNSTMRLSEKRYLNHCLFRSDKNQRTWDKLVTLMKRVCCQLSPFSHAQVRRDQYLNKVQICLKNGNQVVTQKMKPSGFSLKDTKRANSCWSEIWDPEARTSSRVWQKKYPGINGNYWFSANGNWSYYYRVWDQLLQEERSEQNRALRETRIRNMRDIEELQKCQMLKVDDVSRRKLTEDQNTIMELRAKIQELQNEGKLYEWLERF